MMFKHAEKKRELLIVIFTYIVVLTLTYSGFSKDIMTSDYIPTWPEWVDEYPFSFINSLSGGRFFSFVIAFFYKILYFFGATHFKNLWVNQLLGIIFYAFSGGIIYKMLLDAEVPDKLIAYMGVLIGFINPMIVETFMYGALDFGYQFFLATLAAYYMCKNKLVVAGCLSFVAVGTYQSTILLVALICAAWGFISYKNNPKKLLFFDCTVGVMCGVVAVANIVLHKIVRFFLPEVTLYKSYEVAGGSENSLLHFVFLFFKSILGSYIFAEGMMPLGFCFLIVIILFVVGIIGLVRGDRDNLFLKICLFVLTFVGCLISPFLHYLVAGIYGPARVIFPMFISMGLLCVCVSTICDLIKYQRVCRTGIFVFLFVSFTYTQIVEMNCFISQAIDREEAVVIQNTIEEYETKSGNEITTIVQTQIKESPLYYYDELLLDYHGYCLSKRITYDAWARVNYLNYVNGTSYIEREMDNDDYYRFFSDVRGGSLDICSQIHFDGDTMYWVVY